MCYLLLLSIALLVTGCQYLPAVTQDIEDMVTNTAINIEVSKEVFEKEANFDLTIKVQNKDEPAQVVVQSK